MAEVRRYMFALMDEIRDGSCPLATAREIHLAAHRAVMDAYADCKKEELGLRQQALKEAADAMKKL